MKITSQRAHAAHSRQSNDVSGAEAPRARADHTADTTWEKKSGTNRSSRRDEHRASWGAHPLFSKLGAPRSRAEVGSELRSAAVRVTDKPRIPLSLNRRQVEEIRSAPTREAAAARAMEILQKKSGVEPTGTHYGLDWRRYDSRTATVNALLGTSIAHDPRKSDAAGDILSRMAGSMAKALRADGAHACPDEARYRTGGPTMLDLGEYLCAARMAAELQSPLIFDLSGEGFSLDGGCRVGVDLDGDGQEEIVSDLHEGIGLLVLSPASDAAGEAARFFGDRTDLSRWDVVAPRQDGAWDDGFMALRALVERLGLVQGDKQFLDTDDIDVLEQVVGLRMRVGGLRGRDLRLGDLGITRINLGLAEQTDPIEGARVDAIGNRFMRQGGATFVIAGAERDYVDVWFAVHARRSASPEATSSP